MPLSDYINIIISRETQGVARATFDIPLLLADVHEFYERTKVYTGISGIADDFESTSEVYAMAQKLFSQNPHPRRIKVGRKYANVNAKQKFIPAAVPTLGNFKINLGAETTGNIAYNANAAAIKSALEALTAVTTVTVVGDLTALTGFTVEFTGADANKHWATMSVNASGLTGCSSVAVTVLQYGSAVESYTDAIDNIREFDDAWYFLLSDTRTKADIEEIAEAVQAMRKIYIGKSEDAAVITSATDDVASELKAANYTRTALMSSQITDHQLDCGITGLMATKTPGSATWAYKQLEGITADEYSASERLYALGKNANIYTQQAGINITEQGRTAQGEWIDTMVGIDAMQARMEEELFGSLARIDKIPFTDRGIGIVVGIVGAVLNYHVGTGFVESFTVSAPLASEVSANDKAARLLPDVHFSATLQGAIHFIEVRGTVSL